MKNLNRKMLRSLIIQELRSMIDEDALLPPPDLGDPHYVHLDGPACPLCGDHHDHDTGCTKHAPVIQLKEQEDCGCGTCHECGDSDLDDNYIPDHMEMSKYGDSYTATPGEALGIGYAISDFEHDLHSKHKRSSYMAKPQLRKIEKYAGEIDAMVHPGKELDDWVESKIAQIAQSIGDIYHSLDYKMNKKH